MKTTQVDSAPTDNLPTNNPGMDDNIREKTEEKVIIHTMPKRFYHSSAGSEKSKNVGIIIMVLGFLVLVGIAVFSYYFLIQPQNQSPVSSVGVEKVKTTTNEQATANQEMEADKVKEENLATSSDKLIEDEGNIIEENKSDEEVGIDEEEVISEEETEEEADTAGKDLALVPDTDNDGLTDTEEAMLGTIANLRDSDSDGYEDLSEFLGLYNPAGSGSLITNANIEKYTNTQNGYSLYYLKKMTVENAGGSQDSVIFSFFDGQMIQVVAEANPENLSLEEWYKKQFGVSFIEDGQRLYKKGWAGIRSEDGLTVYLVSPASDKVFSLNYNVSTDKKLSRKAFFEMMINSFSLK